MVDDNKPIDGSGQGRDDDSWVAAAAVFLTILILTSLLLITAIDVVFGRVASGFAAGVVTTIAGVYLFTK